MGFWTKLFDASDFPARWHCGRWTDVHGWLHVLSDVAVASAYFTIPCILAYFILRRKDLPFRKIFLLFGAFILFCGTTHVMEAAIFWWPAYRLGGVLKFLTAAVSWGTVFALIPVVPKVLQMRSPEELEREIIARKTAEEGLRVANAELERRVREAVAHLTEANATLREEREWFRATLSSIGDGVITTDVHGRVLTLNRVAEKLTGWTYADASGQMLTQVFQIVGEKTRTTVENPALRALNEGRIVGLANDTVLIAKDGAQRFIDDSAAPIQGEHGETTGAVLIFRDITERYRAEEALRRQHELTQAITDNATTAILMTDDQNRCTFMNPSAEAMTGFSLADAQGKRLHELIHHQHPDGTHYPASECSLDKALREGVEVRGHEDVFIRKNGELFPVLCNARLVRTRGVDLGTVIEILDLTEQKAIADLLRQSDLRFTQLADAIPQLAWTCRPDGYIDWYNRRWYEFTGTKPEDMQGWGWQFVHDPDVLPQVIERWKASLAAGTPFEMEFPLRGADGGFRPFLTKVLPFRDGDGKIIRWFGTNTDISEQKETQEELRRTALQLSEADRRKDEFLATLAHELRNPLAPIRAGLDWLERAPYDREAFAEVRGVIARQTHQLTVLVDDLLDVSRITRGTLELRRRHVAVADVVHSAVEASRPFLEGARHELTVTAPSGSTYLLADPHRMTQALSNLLINAAKYTPEGGRVWLTAEVEGREVVLSVRDNGVGIPAAMLRSIFELFTQVRRPEAASHSGLGIGLTLVKSLIEMHGGSIEARSEGENLGSLFAIRLPLAEPPEEALRSGSRVAPLAAPARLRVLVVDDNRDAADMLSLVLDTLGHETRQANDGSEAIEIASHFLPDLVLMDLGMPNVNGYEAARRIREQAWGTKMALVALTGWGQREDKERARAAGFDEHFVKPIQTEELEALLARLGSRTA